MGTDTRLALRQRLHLDPFTKCRVEFLLDDHTRLLCPYLWCDTCDSRLIWETQSGWWECPDCHYELTPVESWELLAGYSRAIRDLQSEVSQREGKADRWTRMKRLWRWLGRRT